MNKVKANTYVKENEFKQFRQIAKERDIKQSQLFSEMLQAYLILNSKEYVYSDLLDIYPHLKRGE